MHYDARGALVRFEDESQEPTIYRHDALGRLEKVEYPDCADAARQCTFEQLEYYPDNTGALKARRDRNGQWLSFTYGIKGRVEAIHDGRDPSTAPKLVAYDYYPSGLLKRARNADAAVEYESYDLLGRPGVTRSIRYSGHTGLAAAPSVSDVHTQRHQWSIHDGERLSWRFPAAGEALPEEDDPLAKWLETIVEVRDAGSNIVEQRTAPGRALTSGMTRSVGRLKERSVIGTGATPVVTKFGFDDGTDAASAVESPSPTGPRTVLSGLPLWSLTSVDDSRRAGTSNVRDASRRVAGLRDLAMGDRRSQWGYDGKGRMTHSWLNVVDPAIASPIADTYVDADFRAARNVVSSLTAEQRSQLGGEIGTVEPLSWTAAQTGGHQIGERALQIDGMTLSLEPYEFTGGRRTRAGAWTSAFDAFGRLASIESAAEGRRIEYVWSPGDRLVGRIARQSSGGGWVLEDRPAVLAADGLPAETTFLWDPVVDRLVAIAAAGKSVEPRAAPAAGMVRQVLHGDQGYDDPTLVLRADAVGAEPSWFMPVIDHAGSGSVIAVLDDKGDLVERVLYADSYGDEPRYLRGAVVDRIRFEASKNDSGAVTEVKVTARLSERITAATLATGVRLAAVRADHTVVRAALTSPALADAFTITWTLTPAEWTSLSTARDAAFLEIAVGSSLRAEGWGSASVSPPPAWARRIYPGTATTSDHPLLYRQPLPSLLEQIGTLLPASRLDLPLYEIPSLYSAALPDSRTQLLTGFHALPFIEPATELAYARARWYSPITATFLSADPMGYRDSANLYAFTGGDPVNGRDPSGQATAASAFGMRSFCAGNPRDQRCVAPVKAQFWAILGDDGTPAPTVLPLVGSGPDDALIYVNGIRTDRLSASRQAQQASLWFGARAVPIWNPDRGFFRDAAQVFLVNKRNEPDATTAMVAEEIRLRISSLDPTSRVQVVAHSQGAAVLSSALNLLSRGERRRIDVVSVGGAACSFPAGLNSLTAHVNTRDAVPMALGVNPRPCQDTLARLAKTGTRVDGLLRPDPNRADRDLTPIAET